MFNNAGDEMPHRSRQAKVEKAALHWAQAPSSLGWLGLVATEVGICFLSLVKDEAHMAESLCAAYPHASLTPAINLQTMAQHLAHALDTRRPLPDLPLDVSGTPFEMRVWQALRRIPRGQTRSYQDLARDIGAPTASRAVGRACGANPVALLIPCHRAVGRHGQLVGFAWGLPLKARLLQDEGVLLDMGDGFIG